MKAHLERLFHPNGTPNCIRLKMKAFQKEISPLTASNRKVFRLYLLYVKPLFVEDIHLAMVTSQHKNGLSSAPLSLSFSSPLSPSLIRNVKENGAR